MPGPVLDEVLCSAAGGVASTVVGHPLDTVKVRIQLLQRPGLTGASCAAMMLRNEGPAAFARGLGPPLLSSVLLNSVMFVAFAEARRHLPDTAFGALVAGAASGFAQATLTTPMDWVKIQAQGRGRPVLALVRECMRSPAQCFAGHWMNVARGALTGPAPAHSLAARAWIIKAAVLTAQPC